MSETTPNLPDSGDGEDQDAGPATTPEDLDAMDERDRAEGDPDAGDD